MCYWEDAEGKATSRRDLPRDRLSHDAQDCPALGLSLVPNYRPSK